MQTTPDTAQLQVPLDEAVAYAAAFSFYQYLQEQVPLSGATFAPDVYPHGLVAYIRQRLAELETIARGPGPRCGVLDAWIDIAILACDGAWRAGYTPEEIIACLVAHRRRHHRRQWPAWRTMGQEE